ncbi:unnamed protein product [Rotaria sordida]|uniref:Uncharacterized protein n=1 Tax=Rotaria sordida TaxID=392033 RepID=A0A818MCH3_9BILA|nr:unnamed protein product [Rotaria sordida]CAF1174083.1 unnamed protein product [Rotaria sordida]CAF1433700.1 unnamed protein product [Rotaria sordida]CAF3583823.1 unnamed protein product [Rotaria sordida]
MKMAAPATLKSVSITTKNNYICSINSNQCKNQENINSTITNKSVEHRISNSQQSLIKSTNKKDNSFNQSLPKFRIPKIERSNNSILSPDANKLSSTEMKMETNMNISPQASYTEINSLSTSKLNDEFNSSQGKRKLSLNQYKEHKRLKLNDMEENFSGDIDMRIDAMVNMQNSPPIAMDENSTITSDNQSVVSPKMENISKNRVIKSNLSAPGVKKLIKKRLIWADEKNQALVQTSFFEIDDSEGTDVHTFAHQGAMNISIAQIEKLLERDLRKQQSLQDINSFDNIDNKQNLLPFPTLIPILLPDTIIKSQERLAQQKREKIVLKTFCTSSFLSDRPGELNSDLLGNNTIVERNEPKLIPLDNNTSSSVSNQVSSLDDNNNSTSTNISLASMSPTSSLSPSSSSSLVDNISPEVARILAQAKENSATVTTNHVSSITADTQINPSNTITSTNLPLASIQNFISSLLNISRPNEINTTNIPPTNSIVNLVSNPSVNMNLTIPTNFSINQLLANVLPFSTIPTTFNNSIIQPSSTIFNTSQSIPITTTINSNNNSTIKSPIVPFVSDLDQQFPRFNNNNKQQNRNSCQNNRKYNYQRRLYNNNNNGHNYYQNRNNNNNQGNRFPLK